LLAPNQLLPHRVLTLESLDWRSMSPFRVLLTLAAVVSVVVFGPALVASLIGNALVRELFLLGVLLVPSLRLLFGAELPQPRARRLLPAPPRLSLTAAGEVRRGRVRAGLAGRTVATVVRARDRRGTYGWRLNAGEFDLVSADGRCLHVCGALSLAGKGAPLDHAPPSLPLPAELASAGTLELLELHDGDEVELNGPSVCEQAAAGYRDAVQMMRGLPGHPVEIRRL
jgi:hypothetical protein